MSFPKVDICLSPELYKYHKKDDQIVVVIDVIRASTSICVAISNNVKKLIPVETTEEALDFKAKGLLISGERESMKIEGFDFGNSPTEFLSDSIVGRELAMTTTNGTTAINIAKDASSLIIGSFINSDILISYLENCGKDVLLLCAGWKNTVNIEDTLFAGFVSQRLLGSGRYTADSDSVSLAISVFFAAKNNIYEFITSLSPRLKSKLSFLEEDIKFCLYSDKLNVIPVYKDGCFVNLV